jgi:hypothetical protein
MHPHGDTTDIPKSRPEKISGYVDPARAQYLRLLAVGKSRKISAQLNLILRDHETRAKSPMSEQEETRNVCLDAIWRKANAIRTNKHDQQTQEFAGEIMVLVEQCKEVV